MQISKFVQFFRKFPKHILGQINFFLDYFKIEIIDNYFQNNSSKFVLGKQEKIEKGKLTKMEIKYEYYYISIIIFGLKKYFIIELN